jgi:hypothetical protein
VKVGKFLWKRLDDGGICGFDAGDEDEDEGE